MSENEKFELANSCDFLIAIENAQNGASPLQKRPFHTISDRMRLITELEKKGFTIIKIN